MSLLRQQRIKRGRSQEALAKMVGCDRFYISHLERGKVKDPRISVAHRIARALGCFIEDIWFPEDMDGNPDDQRGG